MSHYVRRGCLAAVVIVITVSYLYAQQGGFSPVQQKVWEQVSATGGNPGSPGGYFPAQTNPFDEAVPQVYSTEPYQAVGPSVLGRDTMSYYRDSESKKLIEVDRKRASDAKVAASIAQYQKELRDALKTLQSASSGAEARKLAREVLSESMGLQFDRDMKQRAEQLKQLEDQLATLKSQFAKREAAKDRLVDLRLQLLENESQGLGFPANWHMGHAPAINQGFSTYPNYQAPAYYQLPSHQTLLPSVASPIPPSATPGTPNLPRSVQ